MTVTGTTASLLPPLLSLQCTMWLPPVSKKEAAQSCSKLLQWQCHWRSNRESRREREPRRRSCLCSLRLSLKERKREVCTLCRRLLLSVGLSQRQSHVGTSQSPFGCSCRRTPPRRINFGTQLCELCTVHYTAESCIIRPLFISSLHPHLAPNTLQLQL